MGGSRGSRVWSPGLPPGSHSLSVSSAAQRHEAVHEGLSQPRPRRQLQLREQCRRAAPCGEPGTPPVQPHGLEEEKAHAHQGQPARQSQQIMAPGSPPSPPRLPPRAVGARPELRPASSRLPGPLARPPPITLHAPCVVVTSVSKNSSSCSSVTPQAAWTPCSACPGTSAGGGRGLEPRAKPAWCGPRRPSLSLAGWVAGRLRFPFVSHRERPPRAVLGAGGRRRFTALTCLKSQNCFSV